MIKVSIFEDNTEIRESLADIINISEELLLAGAFSNANDVIHDIRKNKPDVVLMDIQMPGISGIEALQLIKNQFPEIHVLIQTVFEDNARIFAAICAGASGYILKDSSPEKYIDGIIEVYQGGSTISPTIAKKVLAMFQAQTIEATTPKEEFKNLSITEQRILELLVKGMSYKMIAAECKISFSTVNFHLKNIYRKLHVNSATEAVIQAVHRKWV
ncbi:MAG: response regulator transcription factor [Arcicella sp.]|nr:response regulator transcription factor [Arcicella sp.]